MSAALEARERRLAGLRAPPFLPLARSRWAWRRVRFDVCPLRGGASGTPARRAFDRPIAIACLAERAPCLPSRTCSISSCTNSPAAVLGRLPLRRALRAFSVVFTAGIGNSSTGNMSA